MKTMKNIVTLCNLKTALIYGITQNPETLEYGIVMEFAEHGDLRKYISKNFDSVSWFEKLRTAVNIAEGLVAIHSSGLVHRDLHSGNILQVNDSGVSIGDLGLCQPVNYEATTTEKGLLFMTGIRPEIISPLIPPSIAKIIVKCWDVNPENRPTAEEVKLKLEKLDYAFIRFTDESSMIEDPMDEEYIDEEFKYEEAITVNRQFLESENYIKEMLKNDATTNVHSGAFYTSRLLTSQTDEFSDG
ncbi:hypothetical protein G9A89_001903 [Geosiphon pyriformis]|nr:hypothetical protein G9A89_001903 [Geosiphon pyriformis]